MNNQENNQAREPKKHMTYLLLAFVLGSFGIHNFYSGHKGKGITKLVITLVSLAVLGAITGGFTSFAFLISEIWSMIEMYTVKADANGVPFN